MLCRKITRTARHVSSAFDRFRSDNPLLVRKKLQLKNVCFRKDHPEVELFRWEIAWDAEFAVLLLVLSAAAVLFFLKTAGCCRRLVRRREREYRKK